MMRFKKNRSGMTLLEVVIAMAVFGVMTLGITMTFAAAMKFNTRNMRRDQALSEQQDALQKGTSGGVALNSSFGSESITYSFTYPTTYTKDPSKAGTSDTIQLLNATEYIALKSLYNTNETDNNTYNEGINFQLKTFATKPFGSARTVTDVANNKFRVSVDNQLSDDVVIKFKLAEGTIFEGDAVSGYVHSSNIYSRSLSAQGAEAYDPADATNTPSNFEFGYQNDNIATMVGDPMIAEVYVNGAFKWSTTIPASNFTSSTDAGGVNIVIDDTGISFTFS